MPDNGDQTTNVDLPIQEAIKVHDAIREGLEASGHISSAESARAKITPKPGAPDTVSVPLSPEAAKHLSDALGKGLTSASNIAFMTEHLSDEKSGDSD